MGAIRIQKFLAQSGAGSRREAERLIAGGRVRINGVPARFGDTVSPAKDEVTVDGTPVVPDRLVYYLFNKPRGVLSVAADPAGRPTVSDYTRGIESRLYPLAPLPQEAEGALLLTNDGALAQAFNDPENQAAKSYIATVERTVREEGVARLRRGIRLDTGPPIRVRAVVLDRGLRTTLLRVSLVEARGHGVNEVLAAAGYAPIEFRRVAIANLTLADLAPGHLRPLTQTDMERLQRHMAGRMH